MRDTFSALARGLFFLLAPGLLTVALAAGSGPTLETRTSAGNTVSLVDKRIECVPGVTQPSDGEWPNGRELRLDGEVVGCWWAREDTYVVCPAQSPMCYTIPKTFFKPRGSV